MHIYTFDVRKYDVFNSSYTTEPVSIPLNSISYIKDNENGLAGVVTVDGAYFELNQSRESIVNKILRLENNIYE